MKMTKEEFIKWVQDKSYCMGSDIEFNIGLGHKWIITVWAESLELARNNKYLFFNDLENEGRSMICTNEIDYVEYNKDTYGYDIHLKEVAK